LSDSLAHGTDVSGEAAMEILDERARSYRTAPERSLLASEQIELLLFRLAGETYAIESRFVREVLHVPALTPLPGAPPVVSGVTNLRGEILVVMDPGQALGCPSVQAAPEWVIVLGLDSVEMGIVSDAVLEVAAVRTDSVLAPARAAREIHPTWIRGITSDAVIVLEGQAVLDDPVFHIDQPEM
jgi:purine-binding chemotaxis protein CheW